MVCQRGTGPKHSCDIFTSGLSDTLLTAAIGIAALDGFTLQGDGLIEDTVAPSRMGTWSMSSTFPRTHPGFDITPKRTSLLTRSGHHGSEGIRASTHRSYYNPTIHCGNVVFEQVVDIGYMEILL